MKEGLPTRVVAMAAFEDVFGMQLQARKGRVPRDRYIHDLVPETAIAIGNSPRSLFTVREPTEKWTWAIRP